MLIEAEVYAYLKTKISASVYTTIPQDRPSSFVSLDLVESGKRDKINAATIKFESYASTKEAAATLDQTVQEAIEAMPESKDIYSCEFGGGASDTDTATKTFKYTSYYNIYY